MGIMTLKSLNQALLQRSKQKKSGKGGLVLYWLVAADGAGQVNYREIEIVLSVQSTISRPVTVIIVLSILTVANR